MTDEHVMDRVEEEPTPPPPQEQDAAYKTLADALRTAFLVLKIGMALAVFIFLLQGFFLVSPSETALVKRFGAFAEDTPGTPRIYKPGGPYYAIPVIDKVVRVPMGDNEIVMDTEFWTAPQTAEGVESIPGALMPGVDHYTISGDANIVHTKWQVKYKVQPAGALGPYYFLTTFAEQATGEVEQLTGRPVVRSGPEQLLRDLFRSAVLRVSAGLHIDEILTGDPDKTPFQDRVRRAVQDALEANRAGITLTGASLIEKAPPEVTKPAFDEVSNARADKQARISEADAKARELLNAAAADADVIVNDAQKYKDNVASAAESDAENIRRLLDRFPDDPKGLRIYLRQYHREVLAEVLAKTRHYVVRPGETWYLTGRTPEEMQGKK